MMSRSGPGVEVLDLQMFAGLINPDKPPLDSPLGPAAPRRGGTAPSFAAARPPIPRRSIGVPSLAMLVIRRGRKMV